MTRIATVAAALLLAAASTVAPSAATSATKSTAATKTTTPADPAKLVAESDTVATNADFGWNVTLEIQNPAESGLYLDSLRCFVEDLDSGETRAERRTSIDLTRLVQLAPTIPAQGSNAVQHSGPASAERARLTYRLFCHRADGRRVTLETIVQAVPGASSEYATQFLEIAGKKVEYVLVPALGGTLSPAGMLLVHGHGSNARRMIGQARMLAARGYTVAVVSMPGYGHSAGPAELMGPASVAAASHVLDVLAHSEGIDTTRLGAWGVSRGATVVAELATRRPELKAVVLQSGIYDLWAVYRGTKLAGFREAIVAEAGTDSAAWRDRSPLLRAAKISSPVLVIHGEQDSRVPAGQAHALVQALEARGAKVEAGFSARGEHGLPANEAQRLALDFVRRTLGR